MELKVSVVDVKKFSVSIQSKTLVAEASDLRGSNLQQRLYDDACDAGFGVVNTRTGAHTRWAHHADMWDREGDLVATIYMPTPETLRLHPKLRGWTIHILND